MARHTFSFIWCYLSIFTGSSWTHHCQGFLVYEGQDFIHYPNGNWKIQYSVHSQLTECIPGCSEGSKTTWPWQHLKSYCGFLSFSSLPSYNLYALALFLFTRFCFQSFMSSVILSFKKATYYNYKGHGYTRWRITRHSSCHQGVYNWGKQIKWKMTINSKNIHKISQMCLVPSCTLFIDYK